jgi:hypothetical protein
VIDDGAQRPVDSFFEAESLLSHQRLSILRHEKKIGMASSLQFAFQVAQQRGFTHAITIETHSENFLAEIQMLVEESKRNPISLIIGDRYLDTRNSSLLARYQINSFISDPNSGFRIYPLESLKSMKFFFKKFGFASEVLVRLISRGVPVRSVKISAPDLNLDSEKREGRIRKWTEKYEDTLLNSVFMVIFLMRENVDPFKSSLALAIGVFIGTLPIFGLHTIIIAGLAFLFPLNFLYLWLGSQVSVPPLIPVILLLSRFIGDKILQHGSVTLSHVTQSVLLGSVTLGLILSLSAFFIHYFIKVSIIKKRTQK